MRTRVLAILLLCFCAASLSAGFSLGRPAAVKKRVDRLDDAVRAERATSSSVPAGPNHAPVVSGTTAISTTVAAGGLATVTISASDPDGDTLSYIWTSTAGTIGGSGASVNWLAPSTPGVYAVSCVVSDGEDTAPGGVTVAAVQPGTLKWVFTPSAAVNFSPAAAADGTVYAAAGDGKLYAINPDGTQKWVFTTENTDLFDFNPVVGVDGTIFVVAAGTKTYAVNPNGTLKWGPSPVVPAGIFAPPVPGSDGKVFIYDNSEPVVYALSSADGTGQSTFTAVMGIGLPSVGPDGTIYFTDSNDMLYAVPPVEGFARSTATDVTGISMPPAGGSDGLMYVVKNNSDLYSLNPDGTAKWGPFTAAGVIQPPLVFGTDGAVYAFDDAPGLYRISTTTGAGLPFTALSAISFQGVPGPGNMVYVVDSGTDLYGVGGDGVIDWGPVSPPASALLTAAPAAAYDGTVYFAADDGLIYAVHSTAALP